MKKLRAISIILFCIITCITLTSCSIGKRKDSITPDTFCSKMQDKSFTIVDSTEQFSSTDGVQNVYIAIAPNYTYQIEFYELSDDSQAEESYEKNIQTFEKSKTNVSSNTEVKLANYAKYTLLSNGKYMVISRINNTFIYVNADSDYKDDIDDILSNFGY